LLTADEIEAVLARDYELRGFEIKGPGPRTDSQLFARVARACLGLGNLRDGGHVAIGIADDQSAAMRPGLEKSDLESWSYDDLSRKLAEYADPPLRFDLATRRLSSGVDVVVVQVFEFDGTPHICAKDYPDVLRRGALYVRSRRVPETSEVPSAVDMRDLLDLATEKALRAYVQTAERAGLALLPTEGADVSDDEMFEAERRRGWT
jgi:hypothetical protein